MIPRVARRHRIPQHKQYQPVLWSIVDCKETPLSALTKEPAYNMNALRARLFPMIARVNANTALSSGLSA